MSPNPISVRSVQLRSKDRKILQFKTGAIQKLPKPFPLIRFSNPLLLRYNYAISNLMTKHIFCYDINGDVTTPVVTIAHYCTPRIAMNEFNNGCVFCFRLTSIRVLLNHSSKMFFLDLIVQCLLMDKLAVGKHLLWKEILAQRKCLVR